ncbi:TetR/AcrR family transcriptional regulator [Lysinibacillus endophyticus]|uniref:TetR/AcrR family transcriptional regulator n=1 Tax=Ureibacillus endophyticus TaxID=1978490 RepID=UPI00209DE365|nr:TetR/AcrR family transcriptional regulator [Lysinibacillus endophyticus]MCP1146199.1 TetR/AcrR family transcriptional regulator [Lysinibacillus endophyticus]
MNKRKRQIIHAARHLFIEKGFNDTSIMDIITAANVSKGTFYNHFSSKIECLISILEETREEIINQRSEVALNEDPSNKEVLIKQIALLAYIHRKRNLAQIFESLSGNTDKELKEVIQKYLISELTWLSSRFVDIYGEKIKEFSFECAVQAMGMMQQSLRIFAMATTQLASPEIVVQVIMEHIDAIIERQLKSRNIIFTRDIYQSFLQKVDEKIITKEILLEQLHGFKEKLTQHDRVDGIEYTNFLIKELNIDDDKFFVLESISQAFTKSFANTPHEAEAHEIAASLWRYLQGKRQRKN